MKIKTFVAVLALAGGIGLSATQTNVVNAAKHSARSSYWNHNRKVKVTRKTTFRKFDAYRRRYVKGRRTYKKGKVVTVRAAGEFPGWVLAGTSAGSRYWWISEKGNTKWMTEYKKPKKISKIYDKGFTGNTYTSSNGSKMTFENITNFDLYEEDETGKRNQIYVVDNNGQPTSTKAKVGLLKATFTNKGKATSPKNFMNNEDLEIFVDSTNSKYELELDGFSDPFQYEKKYKKLIKTFKQSVGKGETVTFYAQITASSISPNITDSYVIKAPLADTDMGMKGSYSLKATSTQRIVASITDEREYRLRFFSDYPELTPPGHW